MNLNSLLDFLSKACRFSVNIHDATGVLTLPPLQIERNFKIHTNPICTHVKNTKRGYTLCTSAKTCCLEKAFQTKRPFWGMCPFGLCELVYPVIFEDKIMCVLFIGYQFSDLNETLRKAKKSMQITHVDYKELEDLYLQLEQMNTSQMEEAAKIIESFILLHLKNAPSPVKQNRHMHWIIENVVEYAYENFNRQITLRELSKMYFMNEKYLGRLFRSEIGMHFHQYLNTLRLEKCAEELQKNNRKSILSIAMDNGFNSISYFNKTFAAQYGMPPGEYRKQNFSA